MLHPKDKQGLGNLINILHIYPVKKVFSAQSLSNSYFRCLHEKISIEMDVDEKVGYEVQCYLLILSKAL